MDNKEELVKMFSDMFDKVEKERRERNIGAFLDGLTRGLEHESGERDTGKN